MGKKGFVRFFIYRRNYHFDSDFQVFFFFFLLFLVFCILDSFDSASVVPIQLRSFPSLILIFFHPFHFILLTLSALPFLLSLLLSFFSALALLYLSLFTSLLGSSFYFLSCCLFPFLPRPVRCFTHSVSSLSSITLV